MNVDNRVNFLVKSAYLYSHSKTDNKNIFSFSAGPVIYFNSSVGLEITGMYETLKTNSLSMAKTIYINIGFQIHLERDKNQY